MRRSLLIGIGVLAWGLANAVAAGKAEHVVVVVWDGMRPDFVTPQYTPALYELARRGTFFSRNHAAYVSTTEVNGTALATGMQPEHSGIIANTQYRPEFNWLSAYGTEGLDVVRRGDLASQGHYLQTPTVAETLHAAGFPTMIAGAKPIALLHDRAPKKTSDAEKQSVTLFRGLTLPRSVLDTLVRARDIGPVPGTEASEGADSAGSAPRPRRSAAAAAASAASTNSAPPVAGPVGAGGASSANSIDAWTTKALVRGLWKNGVPKYSLLWLSEPDAAQHATGVGSEAGLSALQSSDDQLAAVLKALEDKNALESTDIFVVSDHGFSTIGRGPDVVESLKRVKFTATRQLQNPEAGDVLVDSLGGTIFFYVFEHETEVIERLVTYLQGTDFAGVIFSPLPMEGTFPLSEVHLAAKDGAPDVAVSMRWTSEDNENGAPGMLTVADGVKGRGSHGSLSRFDLHNTLIAAGPDLKKGFVSELPTGNIDVAPTVLWLLGVSPKTPMDGRVLSEALVDQEAASLKPIEKTIESTRELGFITWHQYLKITRVGDALYYEEGNGRSRLRQSSVSD
jgi:predicted AlkP superfamily pyrophosphatase or phosphodiesterase